MYWKKTLEELLEETRRLREDVRLLRRTTQEAAGLKDIAVRNPQSGEFYLLRDRPGGTQVVGGVDASELGMSVSPSPKPKET